MPDETRFELPDLTLAARAFGAADGRPVLALHGWLDNAASFDRLAPLLTGCRVVAVDSAGHGFSAHRSRDARYSVYGEVGDVHEIAARLGWDRFTLLGHSRGAGIAALYAGTFPERVDGLVLIEGGVPILSEPAQAPDDLAAAIAQLEALRDRTGRVFADRDAAIRERANGFSPVSLDAAAVLATRGLSEVQGGWRWHADQRLKARSELRLSPAQLSAFLERVAAPTIAFLAAQSPFAQDPAWRALLSRIRVLSVVDLDGGHHLHLEGAEYEIAARTLEFLAAGARVSAG